MTNLKEYTQDGGAESDFNQQPWMLEQLEERNKTQSGLYREWNRVTDKYRKNYDNIRWEK